MATYNGAKYIEEQLLSICRQTRKPDEIVISDDGSKDETLAIINRLAQSDEARGIRWIVVGDNPRHGHCGNFEWALRHTTGDYVFLSDQDDVWREDKVEQVIELFRKNPDVQCVCHNAELIGKLGEPLEGTFEQRFEGGKLKIAGGAWIKMDRETFLSDSISWGGIRGMSQCLSRAMVEDALPFPLTNGSHDKWVTFCAILNDGMYYLNLPLTFYRLHGNNTCGSSAYRGNALDRLQKRLRRLLHSNTGVYGESYHMGILIKKRLQERGYSEHPAYEIAGRLIEIGEKTYDAETSGRIVGAVKLCRLFLTDVRYRRSGTAAFLQQLAYILKNGKRKRIENAGGGIQ